MKEVQNSELLKELRKKCENGERIFEEALKEESDSDIHISGWGFRRDTIVECKNTLAKAKNANSLMQIKKILAYDTIPLSLLYKEEFWKEFQDDIDKLLFK